MLSPSAITPYVVQLAALVLGGALLWFGWRGRRAGEHPECRQCGFDLFGRPKDSHRCPECGADLRFDRAVLPARILRRPGFLVTGAVIAVVAGGRLVGTVAMEAGRDPDRWKPSWWLAREAFSKEAGRRSDALGQLNHRIGSGTLSDASISSLVEQVLARQANPDWPWDPEWGDFVEEARLAGKATDKQWARYLRQAVEQFEMRMEIRPRVRRGDPFPIAVSHRRLRLGGRSNYFLDTRVEFAFDDGPPGEPMSLPFQLVNVMPGTAGVTLVEKGPVLAECRRRGANRVAALPVQYSALIDGRHKLVMRAKLRVTGCGPLAGEPAAEVALPLEAAWDLLPIHASPAAVDGRETMVALLAQTRVKFDVDGRYVVFAGLEWPQPLPAGLVHNVFVRAGANEWFAAAIDASAGAREATRVRGPVLLSGLMAETVDVVIRPDAAAAAGRHDAIGMWFYEFEVRDVPVRARPQDAAAEEPGPR